MGLGFFHHPASLIFCDFLAQYIFSLTDNGIDISKTHLNQPEQIIKVNFYLCLQNKENFAFELVQRFNSFCKLFQTDGANKEIISADHSWFSLVVDLVS